MIPVGDGLFCTSPDAHIIKLPPNRSNFWWLDKSLCDTFVVEGGLEDAYYRPVSLKSCCCCTPLLMKKFFAEAQWYVSMKTLRGAVRLYLSSKKIVLTIWFFFQETVLVKTTSYVHEVLVNRLGDLSLHRKSVVRLTDRPDMTLDVYRGRKTTMQQQMQQRRGSSPPHYWLATWRWPPPANAFAYLIIFIYLYYKLFY